MTAIAGVWRLDGRKDSDEACARVLGALQIYGPHDSAQWSSDSIAIGRRLTEVLPEDAFDSQPLIGGNGRYVLAADIRLDNRDELAKDLDFSPQGTRRICDAAILLAAIERWGGEGALERTVGDFAFALWDAAERRLLLARDPLGQRPLHYHRSPKLFAFASMPKGLHALEEVPYALDEEKVAETLVLMPETGSRSYFHGIDRIEPGCVVNITTDSLRSRPYWRPRTDWIVLRSSEEYAEALRAQLDQAVRCRLRGVGDVGAYLSGGLDSGAVVATAARLLAHTDRNVIAFTAVPRLGYSDPSPRNRFINEGSLAAQTAALYPNVEHVIVPNEGRSVVAELDRCFYLYDGPTNGLSAAGWSYSLSNAVRKRGLKVMLGGDLGNMGLSFDGMHLLPELLRTGRWPRLCHEIWCLVASKRMSWRGALVHTFGPWFPPAFWIWLHRRARRDVIEFSKYTAINPIRFSEIDPTRKKAHDFSYLPWKDGVAMRRWVLQKADPGNSYQGGLAGWQVDHRDPTSDTRLLEFCLRVPTDQFLRDGVPRALAIRALSDRLPKSVLEERRRGLQVADWHEDLDAAREEVAEELDRIEKNQTASRAIDVPKLRSLMENWPAGGWQRDEIVLSYRYALQRAVAMGHFIRRATRSNR